jgi:hypothetical protein
LLTRCAQLPNDIADLDRVPHQDRVRQQTQTARLIHNLLVVTGAKLVAIGEEQPAGQFMPRFASIELQLHPSSNPLSVVRENYQDTLKAVKRADSEVTHPVALGSVLGGAVDVTRFRRSNEPCSRAWAAYA